MARHILLIHHLAITDLFELVVQKADGLVTQSMMIGYSCQVALLMQVSITILVMSGPFTWKTITLLDCMQMVYTSLVQKMVEAMLLLVWIHLFSMITTTRATLAILHLVLACKHYRLVTKVIYQQVILTH